MTPAAHSLSVVIPVFNGEGWIGRCIEHVDRAVVRSSFGPAEILVVDDGSTDATATEAASVATTTPTRVITQLNNGRFIARRTGLAESTGEFLLFIDTRVFLGEDSLAYVAPFLDDPDTRVWTADVRLSTAGNNLGRFWRTIEHVAWRRYWRRPRHVQFGADDFDYYPKGTTAFLCPRDLVEGAYEAYVPTVSDPSKINDDTALMRYIVDRARMNIAPGYTCTYHARTTLQSFLKHAHHRGAVLIDGYLRPGTRFAFPIVAVLVATPIGLFLLARHPRAMLGAALGGSVAAGAAAAALGAEPKDAAVLGGLAVPFGTSYLAGMWRGFALKIDQRRRGATGRGSA